MAGMRIWRTRPTKRSPGARRIKCQLIKSVRQQLKFYDETMNPKKREETSNVGASEGSSASMGEYHPFCQKFLANLCAMNKRNMFEIFITSE